MLHAGHLFPMLEQVAPIEDDAVRAEVETTLLRWAAGRRNDAWRSSGAKARREVLKRRRACGGAAAGARDRPSAGVSGPSDRVHGMGAVTAALTLPESRAPSPPPPDWSPPPPTPVLTARGRGAGRGGPAPPCYLRSAVRPVVRHRGERVDLALAVPGRVAAVARALLRGAALRADDLPVVHTRGPEHRRWRPAGSAGRPAGRPSGSMICSTWVGRILPFCGVFRSPYWLITSAARPATCGPAIDVPWRRSTPPSGTSGHRSAPATAARARHAAGQVDRTCP